jgi:hypothetical protein
MAHKIECACNVLEEIEEFASLDEFQRFQRYLAEWIESGELAEIRVLKRYASFTSFDEQWFKCRDCHKRWRLVHPDFPFKGFFRKVF